MEFKVEQRTHPNKPKYPTPDYDVATKFAMEIRKELGDFLKSVVLFGSSARRGMQREGITPHDVDILLIINDLTLVASQEVISAYRVVVSNTASKVSRRLHINTLKLTTFWEYVRTGDPIVINMLRDGVPIWDENLFAPLQFLLIEGKIHPTKEAMWMYFTRAPITLQNANWHVLQGAIDLYWAVIDSAHAALIKIESMPPTPAHIADILAEKLVRKGLLHKKYVETVRTFYELNKKITHRELKKLTGKELDSYMTLAVEFVEEMKKIIVAK